MKMSVRKNILADKGKKLKMNKKNVLDRYLKNVFSCIICVVVFNFFFLNIFIFIY